jgi:hypothetical protein
MYRCPERWARARIGAARPKRRLYLTAGGLAFPKERLKFSLNFARRLYATPSTWGKVKGKMGEKQNFFRLSVLHNVLVLATNHAIL